MKYATINAAADPNLITSKDIYNHFPTYGLGSDTLLNAGYIISNTLSTYTMNYNNVSRSDLAIYARSGTNLYLTA